VTLPVRRLACAVGAAMLAAHASTPLGQAAAEVTPSLALVRQKEAFAARLLADVPAMERIAASGHAEATQLLERASGDYRKALAALEAGDRTRANALLNDVIGAMARARHLVPDPAAQLREERSRYAQLMASLDSLRASYRAHLAHLDRDVLDDPAWRAVERLIGEARALETARRLHDANRVLLQAESLQLDAFGPLLSGKTLDYTAHFTNPADEFRFELERHMDYDALVPLAIAELNPTEGARRLVERYVATSVEMRRNAHRRAAAGDFSGALATIRAGTVYLQRALLAAGLVVPQEGGL